MPDLLAPDLHIVFCGSAPSPVSAKAKAYYANPGNRFWRTLFEIGLTPHLFLPGEYPNLLGLGIGLTDVWKHSIGVDSDLPKAASDPGALRAKIELFQPKVLAFTSKFAARTALGYGADYGPQDERIGATRLYVCCSTSGRARMFWRDDVWQGLVEYAG